MGKQLDVLSITLLSTLCGLAHGLIRVDPLVSTKGGLIRGLRSQDGYSKFLGVPYGVVDETNPFGASSPHPGFGGTYEAYDDNTMCPQVYLDKAVGDINCLKMNIYVPDKASSQNKLPVMIWIHGGAFVEGSTSREGADPYSLLRHDVIVVGLNYRLGIYGFMCLDIPQLPGNQGLKDQVLALRWIHENIEAFGGDVNKITVFGESAGAMSTNLHIFSENEPLFNNAIIESGPALSYWMMVESDQMIPFRLARELGYNATDINESLSYLSTVDPLILVQKAFDMNIANSAGNNQPLTKPCIEKKFEGVENFLTEHPMNSIPSKAKSISTIIGHNNNEMAFQYETVGTDFFERYNILDHMSLGFNMSDLQDDAFDAIRHYYFGDEKISENVRWELIKFTTDLIFGHPSQRVAEKLVQSGNKNVFRYVFSYSGGRNYLKESLHLNAIGATHADELGYLFDLKMFLGDNTPDDQLVVDRMTTLWTNFAKHNNPTPETSELLPIKWESITEATQPYLDISANFTLKNRPFNEDMAFWDIFYKLYAKHQKWYQDPNE